jgi:hypothetical protein
LNRAELRRHVGLHDTVLSRLLRRVLRKLEELNRDPVGVSQVDQAKPFALAGLNGLGIADRPPAGACDTCKQRVLEA